MADASLTYTGLSGSQATFSTAFTGGTALDASHIVVKVGGVTKTITTHYTVAADRQSITFTSGNEPSANVVVERVTPRTSATRLVDFTNGATLQANDLDNMFLQVLYVSQEIQDRVTTLES
jgi:hypothetical protein